MLRIFTCTYWSLAYLLWTNVYSSPLFILNWVLLLLRFKSFYVFWILISYQICDFKYFFPFHGLPFCSVNSVFWRIKILNFHAVQFVCFLCCLCFQCHIQEIIAKSIVVQSLTSFPLRVLELWYTLFFIWCWIWV